MVIVINLAFFPASLAQISCRYGIILHDTGKFLYAVILIQKFWANRCWENDSVQRHLVLCSILPCHSEQLLTFFSVNFLIDSYIYIHIYICICIYMKVLVTQLCSTLCDPMDCSTPGSSIHGILQVRILKLVAIPFQRRSSQPRG